MTNPILPLLKTKGSLWALHIPPRVKIGIDSLIDDAWADGRGRPLKDIEKALTVAPNVTFVENFWTKSENQDVVKAFMTNKLCIDCAAGKPEALEAFKRYAIQDYFYLIDCVKFKALRLATVLQSDLDTLSTAAASVGKSIGYVTEWRTTCTEKLKIPSAQIDTAERSVAELAYANFLQNNTRMEDWFNLHVIMIGCNYGWSKLALSLFPGAVKGTPFYNEWIVPNLNLTKPSGPVLSSSAMTLATFLDVNAMPWTAPIDVTEQNKLFRASLRLETALFNAAYEQGI